jgi:indolepyruvate ferredoxin oxidoreductase alpha subunit
MTGAEALARGLTWLHFHTVTGYPGSPATAIMEHFKRLTQEQGKSRGTWMINEKVAVEYVLGHAIAGRRAAAVLKNVGFNLIVDSLVIAALTGVRGACVILLGDDPGARQSSHEEDARPLAVAAEVPLLEPSGPGRSPKVLARAVEISERYGLPVVIRFTPTFVEWEEAVDFSRETEVPLPPVGYPEEPVACTCMPHQAVALHGRLHHSMDKLSADMAMSEWTGDGPVGIIAVGDSWLKISAVCAVAGVSDVRVMRLEEVNPLPSRTLVSFFDGVDKVLVVEETLPVVEEKIAAFCHTHDIDALIWGKLTGHLPREDVVFTRDVYRALCHLLSREIDGDVMAGLEEEKGGWGEGTPPCEGCPYAAILEVLRHYWATHGVEHPVLAGEPGCSARLYYGSQGKLDLFLCMGSANPLVSALAGLSPLARPVAVIGDSAFLNSGIPALVQACRMRARILSIIVNNYSAALTGFQPPLELEKRATVDTLSAVIRGAHPGFFESIPEGQLGRLPQAVERAHGVDGTAVILVNAPCPDQP